MRSRYRKVKRGGRTFSEHREVAARAIGRPLLDTEHVHHKDGNRYNNDPANLEVVNGLMHVREHAEARRVHPREKDCQVCGRRYTPHRTKRKRSKTCSVACANKLRGITERATKAQRQRAAA